MRANRRDRRRLNDTAQVGIGTMIVFIATVLVAAIAAGVLIDTSGKLQERSSRTGQEATSQVSSNLNVASVLGRRDTSSDVGLKDLDVFVTLAPGAQTVDLSQLRIQLQNGSALKTLNYTTQAVPVANQFAASAVRDADASFTSANPVMTSGDLVNITVALDTTGVEYAPRDSVIMVLLPEVGNKVAAGFTTPASYGTNRIVELR